jgi:hypothetical protein
VESEESEIGYARRVVRGQFNLGDKAETIVIPEIFLKTLKGDRFMHLDVPGKDRIIVLATPDFIQKLSKKYKQLNVQLFNIVQSYNTTSLDLFSFLKAISWCMHTYYAQN